ncbi:unnamed protein product [Ceratitis capitata]|uniref:(Mediterranean fruit fly) hypothetical protein n=1 Tax=Ceratitis capitata TaxID=7213 RepID=A0A811V631_CERCA|nr:unnamed protein product [Ceratitis capitata]
MHLLSENMNTQFVRVITTKPKNSLFKLSFVAHLGLRMSFSTVRLSHLRRRFVGGVSPEINSSPRLPPVPLSSSSSFIFATLPRVFLATQGIKCNALRWCSFRRSIHASKAFAWLLSHREL